MFRRWLSNFIRKYKEKIKQVLKILIGVGFFVVAVAFVFSNMKQPESAPIDTNVYKPSETVISGSNVEETDFKEENNLVQEFVEYCNNGNIEEAYNLLTNECKEKIYPTLSSFKNGYYNVIFGGEEKEYNLQSWVNNGNYHTYRIRFLEDFITTGNYDDSVKYEDYITIVTNGDKKELNINSYIKTESIEKQAKIEEIEVISISKDIYMDYEIYLVNIKNISDNDILLDSLENNANIKLLGSNGAEYKLEKTNIKSVNLKLISNEKKNIKLKFIKQYGSEVSDAGILFKRVILDYQKYLDSKNDYNNYKEIEILF